MNDQFERRVIDLQRRRREAASDIFLFCGVAEGTERGFRLGRMLDRIGWLSMEYGEYHTWRRLLNEAPHELKS